MADTLIAAWREAADDLGIRVDEQGQAVLVRDFGGPGGMLCVLSGVVPHHDLVRAADAGSCGYSELNGVYLDYERELYVEMLNDWQWTASTEPPPWYTGQP